MILPPRYESIKGVDLRSRSLLGRELPTGGGSEKTINYDCDEQQGEI